MNMQLSDAGLLHLQNREALRLVAYPDSGGVWTIGWGHTGPEVHPGLTITRAQAVSYLRIDVQRFVKAVNENVHVTLTQSQFDALVSFVFNVGISAFERSTVLELLNKGDYVGAESHFMDWIYVNHKVVDGLVNRRRSEQQEFEGQ